MLLVPSSSSSSSDEHTDSEEDSSVRDEHTEPSPAAAVEDVLPETISTSRNSNAPSLRRLRALVQQQRTQLDVWRFAASSERIRDYEKLLNVVVYADTVERIGDAAIVDALMEMLEHCGQTLHFGKETAPHLGNRYSAGKDRSRSYENTALPFLPFVGAKEDGDCRKGSKTREEEEEANCKVLPEEGRYPGVATEPPMSSSPPLPRPVVISPVGPRDPPVPSATPVVPTTNISVARYLQERGGRAETALLDAASQDGRLDVVQYVSEHCDAAIHLSTNAIGYTALHLSCAFGHAAIVEYLIQVGVDVNVPGGTGKETAVHIAIEAADTKVFDCLVASGKVDMQAANAAGETAWFLAGSNGFWYGVQYFLEHGHANIHDPLGCFQETILHVASHKGDMSMVQHWMAQGADPAVGNWHGETALHIAVRGGFLPLVQYLIETGRVSALAGSHWGSTPLLIACAEGDVAMVQYLRRACPASVAVPNVFGRTPRQVAENNGHWHVALCFDEMV
jgi:ankyrin repeat protein